MHGGKKASLVSVIIPTHNRACIVLETVDALRKQTYRPLEIIVVDDGSEDDTLSRITQWKKAKGAHMDAEVRLLHQAQNGPASARNHGLKHADGEFVQFLDSDDRLSTRKIEMQVAILEKRAQTAACYCAWRSWFKGSIIPFGPRWQKGPITEDAMILGQMSGRWFLPPHAYLFRRSVLATIGPWNEELSYEEDAEYILRLLTKGFLLEHAKDCHVEYSRHAADQVSSTRAGVAEKMVQSLRFRRTIFQGLSEAEQKWLAPAMVAFLARIDKRVYDAGQKYGYEFSEIAEVLSDKRMEQGSGTIVKTSKLVSFGRSRFGSILRRCFADAVMAWCSVPLEVAADRKRRRLKKDV